MSEILESLGLKQEDYENGEASAVAKSFEALPSGV